MSVVCLHVRLRVIFILISFPIFFSMSSLSPFPSPSPCNVHLLPYLYFRLHPPVHLDLHVHLQVGLYVGHHVGHHVGLPVWLHVVSISGHEYIFIFICMSVSFLYPSLCPSPFFLCLHVRVHFYICLHLFCRLPCLSISMFVPIFPFISFAHYLSPFHLHPYLLSSLFCLFAIFVQFCSFVCLYLSSLFISLSDYTLTLIYCCCHDYCCCVKIKHFDFDFCFLR